MSSLSRNTFILIINNAGTAALGFVLSVIIARGAGDATLGRYAAIMAWIFPLSLLIEGGIGTLLTRDIAHQPQTAAGYLRATYPLRLIAGSTGILLIWLCAPLLSDDNLIVTGLRIAALLMLIDGLFASYTAVFRAWEIMLPIMLLNLGLLLIQVSSTLIIVLNGGSLLLILGGIVAADIVQLGAAQLVWRRLPRPVSQITFRPALKKIMRRALPFMMAGVLATLQMRMMIVIVEQTTDAATTGQYAVASRFLEATRLIPRALFAALLPGLSALVGQTGQFNRMLKQVGGAITLYGLLNGILFFFLAEPLINLTFGAEFIPGATVLILLIWALLPGSFRDLLTLYHYAHGQEWAVNAVLLTGILFQSGAGFFVVRSLQDAALSVIISELIIVGGLFIHARLNRKNFTGHLNQLTEKDTPRNGI